MTGEILTILLVEDNDDHAELVMRSFDEHRVANRIIRVADGEAAINYLFREGEFSHVRGESLPNLILLDLRLPKIDGLEVLTKIKTSEELRKIPVVVLTSSEAEKDITKSYSNYVNSYLVKPLDFDKFTKMMNELGFYWLGWNKKPF
ncbi:MAG: response regulator [Candidatus Eremiobacterota bacterium]